MDCGALVFFLNLFYHHTLVQFLPGKRGTKMPTNFTVVPVEDGNSSTTASGEAKPISLSKIFKDGDEVDNEPESPSGS